MLFFILCVCRPQLTGADDIINHLYKTYGPGVDKIPSNLKGGGLFGGGNKSAKLSKKARPDFRSIKPLTLYGYEGVGGVKAVREVLTDLGLAHTFIVVANGSTNRYVLQIQIYIGVFAILIFHLFILIYIFVTTTSIYIYICI